jgi:cell division septum initiation protein DivIVA
VQEGFERIERLLGEVRERDQRIAELETELARRTDALSSRQRKKLGLG